ncbi:MAG: alpha/beta hydrolase family protein [Eubacteriales bacterium]|nr:alpha/beta hydrolase family protein [Eubacteriales bacterium]
MAFIELNFFSEVLKKEETVNVIFPHGDYTDPNFPPRKTLYLLHGAFGNYNDWIRRTSIERYAQEKGLCVVMPSGYLSGYMDMRHGGSFYKYIVDELPQKMRSFFPLSDKREDNYIAGLSMGGTGSLILGLSRPEQYSVIASLSAGMEYLYGFLDDDIILDERSGEQEYRINVFENARKIAAGEKPPVRLFVSCGTEDGLLPKARATRDYIESLKGDGIVFSYHESEGHHNWVFWDREIKHFIDFLELPNISDVH